MKPLSLGQRPLKLEEVWEVAVENREVELSDRAKKRIQESHRFLRDQLKKKTAIYGVNTGFGALAGVRIPAPELSQLQINLLRSHACGLGTPIEERFVRAMLLLRASQLSEGHSGVSLSLVQRLLDFLNLGIHPIVPAQGSVGASGDLAPLAHCALVLIGEGSARLRGKDSKVVSGAQALKKHRLKPLVLQPKEGLALINGTQFMCALGALGLLEAEDLAAAADLIGAVSCEALRGSTAAFDPLIHRVRPHAGQVEVARRLKQILQGPKRAAPTEITRSHADCARVQDPYSLRCIPQVHGATREALRWVRSVLEREIQSVTDNPLVFAKERKILSGGNFHGQVIALALDALAIATAELASISEQRTSKLMNPSFSELPAFLTAEGGLNSGFMIAHVSAAAIVSENKTLCHPASVDSIPTSTDKEDHVSMGAWGARKALSVIQNTRQVLAIEFLAGLQGLEFLRPLKSSEVIEALYDEVRSFVPPLKQDRVLHRDIEAVEKFLKERRWERWSARKLS